jgi:DNA-binding NtrC family response regulator
MHTVTALRNGALSIPTLSVHAVAPSGQESVVQLGMDPLVIGTGADCDLVLVDSHVSRRHCTIALTEHGVVLRDLDSKNGTFVGDLQVREIVLRPDVVVRVGGFRVALRVAGAPTEVPLSRAARFGEAVGGTLVMRALFARLEAAATTDETVLLIGESGTGKELLARAIHDASRRKRGPFAVLDCSAVAPSLVEAEIFGWVKGAFTGADRDRLGLFEQAHGGTLFMDEIGELGLDLQPKLLRALESRQCRRVGSNTYHRFDVRVVAATHRDLAARMQSGSFRQDLYYRLAVLEARVPPLRERRDDVELLAERFLAEREPPLTVHDLPPGSLAMLRTHDWPGNVRELRNALSRMIVFRESGAGDGGATGDGVHANVDASASLVSLPLRDARQQVIEDFEQRYVAAQLRAHRGNVTRAAEATGVSRQFLHRLIERYGIKNEG